MLDICPEPIMNIYFHLCITRQWRPDAAVQSGRSGGTLKAWALSLGYVRYTWLYQGAFHSCALLVFLGFGMTSVSQEQKIHAERGGNGYLKCSVEKVKCSAAALLANRCTCSSSTCEIQSVMRPWFCLITMCEILSCFEKFLPLVHLLQVKKRLILERIHTYSKF